MTKAKTPVKLLAFDAARYLDSEAAIAEYMTAVLEPTTGAGWQQVWQVRAHEREAAVAGERRGGLARSSR